MKKNKSYLSIMGGIGDQIFQFSYAYHLKKRLKTDTHLDITYYQNITNYNKFDFRLGHLAKKNNFILTKNISYLNFKYISYLRLIEYWKLNYFIPFIYNFFLRIRISNFIYEYWKEKKEKVEIKNSYYFGYWHNFIYVKKIKKNIYKNLIEPELKKKKLRNFTNNITNKTVAVHIRGGDFKYLSSHNILSSSYYKSAFNYYKRVIRDPEFHIYTNDTRLSKKILSKITRDSNIKYIWKYKFSDIEEFSIFTKYKYAIIGNSTFGLMSSYLSFERKKNLAPKIWLKGKKLEKEKTFSKLSFI